MPQNTLFNLQSADQRQPYKVTLEVDEQPLSMEIIIGVSFSVISNATPKQLWPHKCLLPSPVKLKTYLGEPLPVKGSMMVDICYGKQEAKLSLLVVTDGGPTILG